nr:MAG TPA: hypothetical protein [Caudoviricetes sp.]
MVLGARPYRIMRNLIRLSKILSLVAHPLLLKKKESE